jgi:hypothetical protein
MQIHPHYLLHTLQLIDLGMIAWLTTDQCLSRLHLQLWRHSDQILVCLDADVDVDVGNEGVDSEVEMTTKSWHVNAHVHVLHVEQLSLPIATQSVSQYYYADDVLDM